MSHVEMYETFNSSVLKTTGLLVQLKQKSLSLHTLSSGFSPNLILGLAKTKKNDDEIIKERKAQ